MQTSPRPRTVLTAVLALALASLAIAVSSSDAAVAASGLIVAVVWGLASTRADVARTRRAGFEMVWRERSRRSRLEVGATRTLVAELRNRSDRVVHVDSMRAVSSEGLMVDVSPKSLDVLPGAAARVSVMVTALRVGRRGIHGLSLGASGVSAAFEVPLTFANVLGIEVTPAGAAALLTSPRGGRLRADPAVGPTRGRCGEGTELRELREIVPGDSFRHIAWKASARRGKLMVREMDIEERDVLWVVVDVSAEHFEGPMGSAPLDRALEVAASWVLRRARKGAAVGIALVTDHVVTFSPPTRGGKDVDRLASVWIEAADLYGADRCGLTIDDLLRLCVEHARPLDSAGLSDVVRGDIDRLLARLDAIRARAPFPVPAPMASAENSARDRAVRHYAASFGIDVPGRRTGSEVLHGIADALERIHRARPRATEVVIIAPPPPVRDAASALHDLSAAVLQVRRRGIRPRWAWVDPHLGLPLAAETALAPASALSIEFTTQRRASLRALTEAGIRIVELRSLQAELPPRALAVSS